MTKRRLNNLRAIVTGASSGIGWHLAKQLACEEVHVLACARREDRLSALQSEIAEQGGRCDYFPCDVTDPVARAGLLLVCQEKLGGLDLLINNAGVGAMGPFAEASPDRLRTIFEVNFFALAELIRESLPLLKSGTTPMIVNMHSVLGHRSVPLKSEYCASKFAVHGFSDALRAELAATGIDVLLVSPSTTDSDFFESAIEDTTEKNWKQSGAMSPEKVATATIRAIKKGRQEIILTLSGRALVWFDRLMPGIANRVIARFSK